MDYRQLAIHFCSATDSELDLVKELLKFELKFRKKLSQSKKSKKG